MSAFIRLLWSGRDRRRPNPSHQERIGWDRDSIIDAVQRWADLFGCLPVASDWSPAMARRRGRLDQIERASSSGPWPGTTTVQRHFGSWRAALEAAGFEQTGQHVIRNPHTPPPPETRFWSKVNVTPDCWEWLGAKGSGGYGQLQVRPGQSVLVHRFAYELLVDAIPEGLQIDHLCRNPGCVNPLHLEPVTARENSLRSASPSALNAEKTHCVHGHPFDETNTRMRPTGHRECRECHRIAWRAWNEERKVQASRRDA